MIAAIKRLLVEELEVEPDRLLQTEADIPLLGLGVGLDSIEALRLVTALEREFGIEIPDASLTADLFANVATLADYVSGRIAAQSPRPER